MRALIVDDSQFIRSYLRALLEVHGIVCEAAGDGAAGLDCVRRFGPYRVALIDWNMPGMSGLEMVQALRQDPALDGMKIVMVTTEAENDHIEAALHAGADEYLMKPFDEAGLIDKLQMVGVVEA
ncbi:response regulator [Paracidobacterium acidisoli]|uniref:Response regulator n=1 Tax=Paracidobacterium acidisoli TaxID=2303751 RepID=A0A372IPX2_9BACT|nr:response regulator [Paracidobacterium acidisoli]MBT9331353.1 response regulator [Paracidobacterium acidisoli]